MVNPESCQVAAMTTGISATGIPTWMAPTFTPNMIVGSVNQRGSGPA
jgi:hypothetical protein